MRLLARLKQEKGANRGEELDKIGESTREIVAVAASRWVEKVLRTRLETPILILFHPFQ